MLIMDVKGFMSKLRAQVGFHFKARTERGAVGFDDESIEEDVMYEDFVVVTDKKKQVLVDGLPSYSESVMEPRDYPPDVHSPSFLTTQNSKNSPTPARSQQIAGDVIHHPVAPIEDIPFELHPSMCVQQRVHMMFQSVDLQTNVFNSEKYSYDFAHERKCVSEFC